MRRNWRPEEDKVLMEQCKVYNYNWRRVSKYLNQLGYQRSGKSCKERFQNQLNPAVNKDHWSQGEIDQLFYLQTKFGNKWRLIAKEIPHRTDGLIKNYFYSMVRKVLRRLAKTVNGTKNGSQMTKTLKPSVISQIFCTNIQEMKDNGIDQEFAQMFRKIILKYRDYNVNQNIDTQDVDQIKQIYLTLQKLNDSYNNDLERKAYSKKKSKYEQMKRKKEKALLNASLLERIKNRSPIFTCDEYPLEKLYSKFQINIYPVPPQFMAQSISNLTSQNPDPSNVFSSYLIKPEQYLYFSAMPPYYSLSLSAYQQSQQSYPPIVNSFKNQSNEVKEEQEA